MTAPAPTFEAWAIVELMGHQKVAGKVSEEMIAGAKLMRIDVPEVDADTPGFTRYVNAQTALYAMTPVAEEVARAFQASVRVQPFKAWEHQGLLHALRGNGPAPQLVEGPGPAGWDEDPEL